MILNTLHQELMKSRRNFDPNSQEDLEEFRFFINNKKWKGCCPFNLEWPYLTIPDMLKDKITKNILK